MASDVDICNLALSRLGDDANIVSINPPEGSPQAEHCARFYPLARDVLLQMHPWSFAVREETLAPLAQTGAGWAYVYTQPAQALSVLAVLPAHSQEPTTRTKFVTQMNAYGHVIILTNEANARVRFVARVTDSTQFPPLFVDALAWLLASYLAGPILKGDVGAGQARACLQGFNATFAQARLADAHQRHAPPEHTPAWMAAR